MKVVKWIVLGVIVVVIIIGVIVYFNLNGIIERTVEKQSTASLNLQTELGSANLALFGGSLGLDDLQIASPEGFNAPQMLTLDDASVKVSYGQLREDPVRINSINLKGPKLVIEQSGGKFNIQALMQQDSKAPPPEEGEPLKLIIDDLKISEAQVVFLPGLPGLAQEIVVPIPDIELQKVGTGEGNQNGAEIKRVVMEILTAMSAKASESEKLPEELRTLLKLDVNQIASQLGERFDKEVENITQEVGKRVDEEVGEVQKKAEEAIGKGLGDLLKKDEKKD